MAVADLIPQLTDDELVSLHANASRLGVGASGVRQAEAASLIPLIDAELAEREARKPPKAVKAAKPARKKPVKAAA